MQFITNPRTIPLECSKHQFEPSPFLRVVRCKYKPEQTSDHVDMTDSLTIEEMPATTVTAGAFSGEPLGVDHSTTVNDATKCSDFQDLVFNRD
jgi:hypothetical protein